MYLFERIDFEAKELMIVNLYSIEWHISVDCFANIHYKATKYTVTHLPTVMSIPAASDSPAAMLTAERAKQTTLPMIPCSNLRRLSLDQVVVFMPLYALSLHLLFCEVILFATLCAQPKPRVFFHSDYLVWFLFVDCFLVLDWPVLFWKFWNCGIFLATQPRVVRPRCLCFNLSLV